MVERLMKICIIDTDCINFLLSFQIGRECLRNTKIIISKSIFEELTTKAQQILKNYELEIEELTAEDREYAANLIYKLNGRKEYKNWYKSGRNLRRIKNVGEAEGAALAHRLKIDIILLDQHAQSVIRKAFKFIGINVISLKDFGSQVLNSEDKKKNYLSEIKRRLHIF